MSSRVGSCTAITMAPFTQSDPGPFQSAAALFGFPDVNVSLERSQLEVGATAIHGAVDRPVHIDADTAPVALCSVRAGTGDHLHIKIRKHIALIAAQPQVGLHRGGEVLAEISIWRREG